jgi:intein/homing endonuclease
MKGTLFSADFVEDEIGNLRLLEINTDTSTSDNNLAHFNYDNFITLLDENNITEVVVIHKPYIHQHLVDNLSASLNISASFITSFTEVKESTNIIYPTSVQDTSNKFILRLAYDESAILDSEYCKGNLNLLKLFADANQEDMITQFYHSSSLHGEYNTLDNGFNSPNLPDYVVKNSERPNILKFYKVGSESESDTNEIRVNRLLSSVTNEYNVIEKYHTNNNIEIDNKTSSIRVFSILYGSDLDLVEIAHFKSYSTFELPTVELYDSSSYINELDAKHYYEFASNFFKITTAVDGILNTHLVLKSDDTEVEVSNLVVGDVLKSYYVSGTILDETEGTAESYQWNSEGSSLPSGSYLTSSVVVYINEKELHLKSLCNINVNEDDGSSIYVGLNKSFLVYDSLTDSIKWKLAMYIQPNTDYLLDYDGSTAQVTFNNVIIINESNFKLVEIDVEDTDTYIIAGSTPVNAFITHNAPCFVAGTKITLSDGTLKNIEDVVSGDVVSTFNLDKNKIVSNVVNNVFSKKVNTVVEYTFENGDTLKCTLDHPIYVIDKGWSSFSEELSNKLYTIDGGVKNIQIGDIVKLSDGNVKIVNTEVLQKDVVVYNLQDIENNHNFFANNILVHNRYCFIAGTKVTMADGSEKNIEDVVEGDIVLSFNESTLQNEPKKVIGLKTPIHSDLVKYEFANQTSITSTFDHPFYVGDLELASYTPFLTNKRYELDKNVKQIKIGDMVYLSNGVSKTAIKDIIELDEKETQTYIITIEDNHNFYANGILVHNK